MTAAPGRTWRRRLLALAFGLLVTALLWAAGELVCGQLNARRAVLMGTREHVPMDGATSLPRIDPLAATAPAGALRMRTVKRNPAGVIYDVVYTIVSPGYRFTPCEAPGARDRALVFLGCSYTIGDGVQDGETLPASTARVVSWGKPYNLGYPGWGTHKVHALLEQGMVGKVVKERARPIAIYTFIDAHVRRAIGSLRNFALPGPSYELVDGEARVTGTFPEARGRLFPLLLRSEVLEYFGVDLPVRIGEAELDLVAALMVGCRDSFRRQFPDGRFVVVFFPGSRYAPALEARISKAGVESLDESGLFDVRLPEMQVVGDGHPSPEAYRRVAAELGPFLEKN